MSDLKEKFVSVKEYSSVAEYHTTLVRPRLKKRGLIDSAVSEVTSLRCVPTSTRQNSVKCLEDSPTGNSVLKGGVTAVVDTEERVLEEVIEIRKFTKDEAFRMEEKGFFFMPNKITYFRKTAGDECEILGALSRNKRKKMKKAIRNSSDFEFAYENPLTEKTYQNWYDNVYVPNVALKKHGRIVAARDWWKTGNEDSCRMGVFFKKKGDVVSGIVAKGISKSSVLPKRMSI
ncbi:MAG: hypothetical protein KAJ24_04665, partial [Candidatus Aenigmarchaeota archaeon]|nr:hypothetical protein [Candidatus Aenigmarchaeota archaeon]